MEKSYVAKVVARKSLVLSLSNTLPEFLWIKIDSYRIFHIFFAVLNSIILIAVRQDGYNLKSAVIIQELELAIHLPL